MLDINQRHHLRRQLNISRMYNNITYTNKQLKHKHLHPPQAIHGFQITLQVTLFFTAFLVEKNLVTKVVSKLCLYIFTKKAP